MPSLIIRTPCCGLFEIISSIMFKCLSFIESASVYLTGNNLLLLTNYKWGDPEVSDGGANTVAQGVADDQYPYASSVALGFRLNL